MAAKTALRGGMVALGALVLGACTNTVVPPAAPAEPAAAFLFDHGRHASLVLERDDGVTRYSYGQWDWYVENRRGPFRASGTLFGSNAAGLGRRHLPGPAELDAVRRRILVPVEGAWRMEVPSSRVRELTGRLDGIFEAQSDTRTWNRLYDLEFVRHPAPYRAGSNNSNHVVADWLRTLGAEVDMGGPYSRWEIEHRREQ